MTSIAFGVEINKAQKIEHLSAFLVPLIFAAGATCVVEVR